MDKKIRVTQVGKSDYQETLDLTEEQFGSLNDLFEEQEDSLKTKKQKKRDKWKK